MWVLTIWKVENKYTAVKTVSGLVIFEELSSQELELHCTNKKR